MEIGSLEWYKYLSSNFSVSTVGSLNEDGTGSKDVTALLIIKGQGYSVPLEELDKYKSNWNEGLTFED